MLYQIIKIIFKYWVVFKICKCRKTLCFHKLIWSFVDGLNQKMVWPLSANSEKSRIFPLVTPPDQPDLGSLSIEISHDKVSLSYVLQLITKRNTKMYSSLLFVSVLWIFFRKSRSVLFFRNWKMINSVTMDISAAYLKSTWSQNNMLLTLKLNILYTPYPVPNFGNHMPTIC